MATSTFHHVERRQPLMVLHGRPVRRGFTMIEIVVAMVVFGLALTGLFPLIALYSRDLQPARRIAADGSAAYRCGTPARDGNINGDGISPPPVYVQHVWYMAAFDDPWVRKLGAGARLYPAELSAAAPSQFTTSASPIPVGSSIVQQDDYNGTPGSDDGDGTYSDTGWDYNPAAGDALGNDQHRHEALAAGETPIGSATWTLTVAADGWYSIQATWAAAEDQVTDAVYAVSLNGAPLAAVASVNQHDAPGDITDAGGQAWTQLTTGLVHLARGDAVQVRLNDVRATSTEVGKFVATDGVRIVRNVVNVVSLERTLGGINNNSNDADVTANVAVTVSLPQ